MKLWLSTMLLACLAIPCAASEEEALLLGAVDQMIDVRMRSGDTYNSATLLRVINDRKTDEPRSLRLRLASGDTRTIGLRAVQSVTRDGAAIFESPDAPANPNRRMTRSERRAAEEAAEQAEREEQHRKWLARLQARGVQPWPTPTDAEHEAAIAKHKKRGEEAQELFPNLRLYETERFLVYSNIPSQQVSPFIARLDQMHEWMRATYNLSEEERVWLGKAPVFAFLTKEQFIAFERHFYQGDPVGAYGLCHQDSTGEVLISCYRGQQPMEFAAMLVHETSHGFIHRYQTKQWMPSWVNEGMADYIGQRMVPQSRSVKIREAKSAEQLRERPVIRAGFFKDKIEFDEYGLASSLTRFMLTTNQENYVKFIQGIKEGMPWEESLRESYKAEPDELLAAYSRWLRAPNLRVE